MFKIPELSLDQRLIAVIRGYQNEPDQMDQIIKLLDEGADPNYMPLYGYPPLIGAIERDRIDVVELLLDRGANVNIIVYFYGRATYPLYMAILHDNENIVDLLINRGAEVNVNEDMSPLALAMIHSQFQIADRLLKAGADPNFKNSNGLRTLNYVVRNPGLSNEIQYLLDIGANPFVRDRYALDEYYELLAKYQWKRIKENVDKVSKQYSASGNFRLPTELWRLVLLRNKQQTLCKNLSNDNFRYVLMAFANYLDIPTSPETTKAELCGLISRQLAWGGPYSEESKQYFQIRENREKIYKVAQQIGINISQSFSKILDDIGEMLKI